MRQKFATIRWRLFMGVIALVMAVAVTLPAAAARVDLGKRVADIWPNALSDVADIIWPNAELMDVIWPNLAPLDSTLAGTTDPGSNPSIGGTTE